MKIRNLILSVAFLTWASSASAQTMTEITGRQWMLPSWQKLMSTSECAELMKTLYDNQKSKMGF